VVENSSISQPLQYLAIGVGTMDLKEAFAKVLRDLRSEKGVSQERLALDCGLDRTYISKLERKIHSPSLEAIFKIALILQVEPSEIVHRVEERIKDNQ